MANILLFGLAFIGLETAVATTTVQVRGKDVGEVSFHQLDGHSLTGRPAYESADGTLFLYHISVDPVEDGVGRWVISDVLWAADSAVQFIDSWAVVPCMISEVQDNPEKGWLVYENDIWEMDHTFTLTCQEDPDDLIYLEASVDIWSSGFFVKMNRDKDHDLGNVYMKIKRFEENNNLFLYKLENRWLIGDNAGEDNAIAFVDDVQNVARVSALEPMEWLFHTPELDSTSPWSRGWVDVLSKRRGDFSIMETLREYRSISNFPDEQRGNGGLLSLRNGIGMPAIGFGTGGIPDEIMYSSILTALNKGYRLLDLAREYFNEQTVRDIFVDTEADSSTPNSHEVFLLTKVWPTELGFEATSRAIHASRRDLGVTAIDNYMLHWPACYSDIQWMHCDTTVNPEGHWHQSYKALEKAYAEGDIMSIGISNFDTDLLDDIHRVADCLPHLVQNYASVGEDDADVRAWCKKNDVHYQPYASARNEKQMKTSSPKTHTVVSRIAKAHSQTNHAVIYRYFLQSGAAIIPRSTDSHHMSENLDNLNWSLTSMEMRDLSQQTSSTSMEEVTEPNY